MNVEIVLYEGFDELDAIGPFEVFANADRLGGAFDVSLVTLDPAETVTASHGLRMGVDGTLSKPDLLVVPGGGWNDRSAAGARAEVEDGRLPTAVERLHDGERTIASVCTGAMILAHAGVLDGRAAVTHHGALDDLREFDVEVREKRVVDSAGNPSADRSGERSANGGSVVTAGGVTAGIDLALHLVERLAASEVADRVAAKMEYERRD